MAPAFCLDADELLANQATCTQFHKRPKLHRADTLQEGGTMVVHGMTDSQAMASFRTPLLGPDVFGLPPPHTGLDRAGGTT